MSKNHSLGLHEEILLLALRDETGTIASGTMYQYAIGGAVLAELLLDGRVRIETVKKKPMVTLVDPTPIGDPVIGECLEKIRASSKRATAQTWVSRFAGLKNLKRRVAEGLCDRGVLREEDAKVLLVFTRKTYPELNPAPERELVERLRQAIFTDTDDIEARTVVLASLANSAGVLKAVFDKKELKGRKDRIEKIVNGEVTGKATRQAIQAMQAAVMMATIMPTIIATTTATR
jgi:Golgi phosphoprotein 3